MLQVGRENRRRKTSSNGVQGLSVEFLIFLRMFDFCRRSGKWPKRFQRLCLSIDAYRRAGLFERSRTTSRRLISLYPDRWQGYTYAAQDALVLREPEEALDCIQSGLRKLPSQLNILTTASDVSRYNDDFRQSLIFAEKLIDAFPEKHHGYGRAAYDLLTLERTNEARLVAQKAASSPNRAISLTGDKLLTSIETFSCKQHPTKVDFWRRSKSQSLHRSGQGPLSPDHRAEDIQPVQYWSQGSAPPQLFRFSEMWREIFSALNMKRLIHFDKATAHAWIAQNAPEFERPFSTAFHFAVEADVFRAAYASRRNCLWLDFDFIPRRETTLLLKRSIENSDATFFFRFFGAHIANGFFISRAESPFFKCFSSELADLDFRLLPQSRDTVRNYFGPARYNRVLIDLINANEDKLKDLEPNQAPSLEINGYRIGFVNEATFAQISPPYALRYQRTNANWKRFVQQRGR